MGDAHRYTSVRWPEPVMSNVAAAVCSLKAALGTFEFVSGRGAGHIAEHRMYNKPACPGDAIRSEWYMPRFQQAWQQHSVTAAAFIRTVAPVAPDTITADSPLLAAPRGTIEQVLAYMLRRQHGEYTADDVVIAQMIYETGNLTAWWAGRPQRSPAGIGVTGRTSEMPPASSAWVQHDGIWHESLAFASWQAASMPAHVGRLLAYALRDEQANTAQHRS